MLVGVPREVKDNEYRVGLTPESVYEVTQHGHPVRDPQAMLAFQIAHRQQRVDQILAALAAGPADPSALTRTIYTDVDRRLLPAARRNVLATLIGLVDEGRVVPHGQLSAEADFALA